MDKERRKQLVQDVYINGDISASAKSLVIRMIDCKHSDIKSDDLHYDYCVKCGAKIESYSHSSPSRWFEPLTGMDIDI